jgi:pimeloyl-ACP methyl ester carboxylesterase
MPFLRRSVVLGGLLLAATSATAGAADSDVQPERQIDVGATDSHPAYTVYTPAGEVVPRKVLLALHGMGSNGPEIAFTILERARASGWVVVAPTIKYGDWTDPIQLVSEELRLQPQLASLLDHLQEETRVPVTGKALVFGFSRGAQAAMRFALFYPDHVESVAAFSAGTYTVPMAQIRTASGMTRVNLPYGTADLEARRGAAVDMDTLRQVRVLVGVAAGDNKEGDVPRQWDAYVGKSRLERATTYARILQDIQIPARLTVVPGSVHSVLPVMTEQAVSFFTVG